MPSSKTNSLTFRYYVYPPEVGRRLHVSRVAETITHNSYDDMMHQIRHISRVKLGITGGIINVQTQGGEPVLRDFYDERIANKAKLNVIIDCEVVHAGDGNNFAETHDLLSCIEDLHCRLKHLEESV